MSNCEQHCRYYETCYPDIINEMANGNVKRKEPMVNYPPIKQAANYNETLHHLMREKDKLRGDDAVTRIKNIKDQRVKAIAALLFFEMSVSDISDLNLPSSRSQVYRIIERYQKGIIFGPPK